LTGAIACLLACLRASGGVLASTDDPTPTAQPVASEPLPPPPISIEVCSGEQQSTTNPNLKVGIAFRDLTESAAQDVKFDILLLDSSGRLVDTRVVEIKGTFAPNELIQPRRAAIGDGLLTQPEYPDSSAWNIQNHFGSGVEKVRCQLHSAIFADGTTWNVTP